MQRKSFPISSLIIALAVIGLVATVLNSPGQILRSVLTLAIFALIVYVVVTFFRNRKMTEEDKKYKQAVKTMRHKQRHRKQKNKRIKQVRNKTKKSLDRKKPTHLRLVEDKKEEK